MVLFTRFGKFRNKFAMNLNKNLTDDDILNHLEEIIANEESDDEFLNDIDFEHGKINISYNKIDNFIS